MAAGWRWLRTTGRPLLALIGATAVVNLALGFFNVALQVLAIEVAGAAHAGLLGVAGVSMVPPGPCGSGCTGCRSTGCGSSPGPWR